MAVSAIRIDRSDTVATLLSDGRAGDVVEADGASVTLAADVARGHKVALEPIAAGDAVIKYGHSVGRATSAIAAGEHVHSNNLATALSGAHDYAYDHTAPADLPAADTTFMGYGRADGRVGTRNEIWILPTVGCVARTAERCGGD